MEILYRDRLDRAVVENDGEPFIITPVCHEEAPVVVSYERGILKVFCSICQSHIATIPVASDLKMN